MYHFRALSALLLTLTLMALSFTPALAGGGDPPPPPSGSCDPASESINEPAFHEDLAYRWAPLVIQDTAGDQYTDFIGKVNYDGDWKGNNNWNNLPSTSIPPYLYYNVIETSTHWFIYYHTFHPRDWNNIFFGTCAPGSDCHENDTENLMVMVRKDGSTYGEFRLLQTQAHGEFYQYALAGSGVTNDIDDLDNDGERGFTLFTDSSVGITDPRVAVYIESKGHGVCEWWDNNGPFCIHPNDMVGTSSNDGVMYYPNASATPQEPADPEGGNWFEHKSPYRLISSWEDMWPLRSCIGDGKLNDGTTTYPGVSGNGIPEIGKALDGDDHADDAATAWWLQTDGDSHINPGDWAIRPAETVEVQLNFSEPVSTNYLYNPYIGID